MVDGQWLVAVERVAFGASRNYGQTSGVSRDQWQAALFFSPLSLRVEVIVRWILVRASEIDPSWLLLSLVLPIPVNGLAELAVDLWRHVSKLYCLLTKAKRVAAQKFLQL